MENNQETQPEISLKLKKEKVSKKNKESEHETQLENPVDEEKYAQYCRIKFLELSFTGTEQQLKKEDKDKMLSLESELKECSGSVPNKTVTAAINNEIVKLVKGVPVPKSIEKIVQSCKTPEYYFG
jgi:hypothetical protein